MTEDAALAIGVIAAIDNNAHYLREVAGLTAAAEQMEAVSVVVSELIETLLDYQQWNPMNCSRDADLHEQAHAILARANGVEP